MNWRGRILDHLGLLSDPVRHMIDLREAGANEILTWTPHGYQAKSWQLRPGRTVIEADRGPQIASLITDSGVERDATRADFDTSRYNRLMVAMCYQRPSRRERRRLKGATGSVYWPE